MRITIEDEETGDFKSCIVINEKFLHVEEDLYTIDNNLKRNNPIHTLIKAYIWYKGEGGK